MDQRGFVKKEVDYQRTLLSTAIEYDSVINLIYTDQRIYYSALRIE